MKNTLTSLALAASLAVGLTGCSNKQAIEPWTEQDITSEGVRVRLPYLSNNEKNHLNGVAYDFDNDGKVDALAWHDGGGAILISQDYKSIPLTNRIWIRGEAEVMSDSVRSNLTKVYQATKDFQREYLKSKNAFVESK
jgi:hypothetical protein